ncbi:hypothetical protein ACQR2B_31010 [Bradyrhizobium oligotrophicum]|uniref:hypothetical protein n=1 Tax=Bradyrhizobium TaxID=374 RepID=UPI003EB923FA
MKTIVVCATAFCTTWANVAGAAEVVGQGAQSCATWTKQLRLSDSSLSYVNEAWVLGFLSGRNFYSSAAITIPEANAVSAWITNYCAANPVDTIAQAAAELANYLHDRRGPSR